MLLTQSLVNKKLNFVSRVEVEHNNSKRRQTKHKRVRKIMALDHLCFHSSAVADTASAILCRVAVENFFPEAHARHADTIAESRNGGKIRGA